MCKHMAYTIQDGALVCQSCGEPSPSERWRRNIYGQTQAREAASTAPPLHARPKKCK